MTSMYPQIALNIDEELTCGHKRSDGLGHRLAVEGKLHGVEVGRPDVLGGQGALPKEFRVTHTCRQCRPVIRETSNGPQMGLKTPKLGGRLTPRGSQRRGPAARQWQSSRCECSARPSRSSSGCSRTTPGDGVGQGAAGLARLQRVFAARERHGCEQRLVGGRGHGVLRQRGGGAEQQERAAHREVLLSARGASGLPAELRGDRLLLLSDLEGLICWWCCALPGRITNITN